MRKREEEIYLDLLHARCSDSVSNTVTNPINTVVSFEVEKIRVCSVKDIFLCAQLRSVGGVCVCVIEEEEVHHVSGCSGTVP